MTDFFFCGDPPADPPPQESIKPAVARYVAKTRAAAPTVTVDTKSFLPPAPSGDASAASW